MPNSPNDTRVPPVAMPVRCGRCCLRCLTLRGISMSSALLAGGRSRSFGGGGTSTALRIAATAAAAAARALRAVLGRGPEGSSLCFPACPAGRRLTLIDPHLHADPAEGGTGLVEAVVDVGAQRVQR